MLGSKIKQEAVGTGVDLAEALEELRRQSVTGLSKNLARDDLKEVPHTTPFTR
jgi:hypothetical protein